MSLALEEAKKALSKNEVPIGAVIVDSISGEVVSVGYNTSLMEKNSLHHAELIAINAAMKKSERGYLENCDLYVTLEPCSMCAGAISLARIRRLYIGALDEKYGAVINGAKIFSADYTNHKPEIYEGILEGECQELLSDFFSLLRNKS